MKIVVILRRFFHRRNGTGKTHKYGEKIVFQGLENAES